MFIKRLDELDQENQGEDEESDEKYILQKIPSLQESNIRETSSDIKPKQTPISVLDVIQTLTEQLRPQGKENTKLNFVHKDYSASQKRLKAKQKCILNSKLN